MGGEGRKTEEGGSVFTVTIDTNASAGTNADASAKTFTPATQVIQATQVVLGLCLRLRLRHLYSHLGICEARANARCAQEKVNFPFSGVCVCVKLHPHCLYLFCFCVSACVASVNTPLALSISNLFVI